MFDIILFLKAVLTGFFMCTFVGPVTIMVIRRTIKYGRHRGFLPAAGSFFADIFHASLVGLGAVAFIHTFDKYLFVFKFISIGIFLFLGIQILVRRNVTAFDHKSVPIFWVKSFLLGFLLVLLNPTIPLLMLTILMSLGVRMEDSALLTSLTIILGILLGEFLWWLFLISGLHALKNRIGKRTLITVNTVSGIFLLLLSGFLLVQAIIAFFRR